MLVDRVEATPRREALRIPTDQGWESLTWEQVGQQAFDLAAGLLALGLRNDTTRGDYLLDTLRVDPCRPGGHVLGRRHHDRLSVNRP